MDNILLQPLNEEIRDSYFSALKSLGDDLNRARQELSDAVKECNKDYVIRRKQADGSKKDLQAKVEETDKRMAQLQNEIASELITGKEQEAKSIEERLAELEKSKQSLMFKLSALNDNIIPCDEKLYKYAEEKNQALANIDSEYRNRLRETVRILEEWHDMLEKLIKFASREAFGNGWGVSNSSANWHNEFESLKKTVGKTDQY